MLYCCFLEADQNAIDAGRRVVLDGGSRKKASLEGFLWQSCVEIGSNNRLVAERRKGRHWIDLISNAWDISGI